MKENENKYNYKRTDFNKKKFEHISNLWEITRMY